MSHAWTELSKRGLHGNVSSEFDNEMSTPVASGSVRVELVELGGVLHGSEVDHRE